MVSYFVRYHGSSIDPDAFRTYYQTRHADLLRQFPNIRSLVLHGSTEWADPFPVRRGDTFLLAQMVFDNAGDLDAALRSQARDDFQRFPSFDGDATHEAMAGKIVF